MRRGVHVVDSPLMHCSGPEQWDSAVQPASLRHAVHLLTGPTSPGAEGNTDAVAVGARGGDRAGRWTIGARVPTVLRATSRGRYLATLAQVATRGSNGAAGGVQVWRLPGEPASVSAVRHWLHALLNGWPCSQVDDAELLASELVTNAVTHGQGSVTVRVWPGADGLRVEVSDHGRATPRLRTCRDAESEGGRGLGIVDQLATRWGVAPRTTPRGTTVWFEMDGPAGDGSPPALTTG